MDCISCYQDGDIKDMTKPTEIKEATEKMLLGIPGVTGVGIGRNSPEKINVYIKSPCEKITCKIPEEIGGVPTQTIVIGTVQSLQTMARQQVISRTARLRPYSGGVSIGHKSVSAGTLGAKCYDAVTGEPLILTNNHVASNETSLQAKTASIGDDLLQPGVFDGGVYPDDLIGELARVIDFDIKGNNYVDAAVVRPFNPDDFDDEILELGKITKISEPTVGDAVIISGRSSGLAESRVVDVNATIKVNYTKYSNVVFRNQIVISSAIGQGGDSGAIVVRKRDKKAVGLLFAGSETITLANRMSLVAQALNINLGSLAPLPSQEQEGGFWGTVMALGIPIGMFGIIKNKNKGRRI